MTERPVEEVLECAVVLFAETAAAGDLAKAERFARIAFAAAEEIRERGRVFEAEEGEAR